ncbi:MAG: hypothetical protein ACI88G_001904, partial [Woeseiaceae bacterium]
RNDGYPDSHHGQYPAAHNLFVILVIRSWAIDATAINPEHQENICL